MSSNVQHPNTGTLYLMPNTLDHGTWSGDNAPDIQTVLPLRVIETAARLEHWVVENAKSARSFLKRIHGVMPLLLPLQQLDIQELPRAVKGRSASSHPSTDSAPLNALLAPALSGHDIGLMSEAGLPAVADPGNTVVSAAHRLGIRVVSLSGPSSLMLALASSGLDGQSFSFVGYIPTEATERMKRIKHLEQLSRQQHQTQLLIETPYRNEALWKALMEGLQPSTLLHVSVGLTLPQGWSKTQTVQKWRQTPGALPSDVPAVFAFLAA